MSLLVAIRGWSPDSWVARFRNAAGSRPVIDAREAFDPAPIHYAAVWKPEPGLLARLPNLKAIFNLGAGVDALLGDSTLPDVPVCRIVNPDLTARMTEYVVLQCLMHLRQVEAYRLLQAQSRWEPIDQPSANDVRVGIMGMGVLGQDSAEVLKRLGFRVGGWSRTAKAMPGVETFAGEAQLDAFLARTDILVVLLPLTPETRGILNRDLFGKLARDGVLGGPVLVNAGRGGLQVEADILAALNDGTLKAASLDVFETEPLPVSSPLWKHPNVILTPHVAADSTPEALVEVVLANIAQHEREGRLNDVVDRRTGY
ncbi:MAG: glyoxylate/hydroxypyruvate reductase A [Beijerinckiaceae bacterium]|jgi:glyoxylate/hydroxypyruvate reductase A|nr:glyoxylate/hydroxypyruvate reductase A [Beijerinckiaceae bacterium]